MKNNSLGKVAIVYPGDRETRQQATPQNNRFSQVFKALAEKGIAAEPVVYHDEFCEEVFKQLKQVNVVLVWVNPIEGGRDRIILFC